MLVFVGGVCLIAFSQITFSKGETVEATVISTGTTDGIAGKETFLMVKTDDGVTSKVTAKGVARVGDEVTLSVLNRVLFRDMYRVE